MMINNNDRKRIRKERKREKHDMSKTRNRDGERT